MISRFYKWLCWQLKNFTRIQTMKLMSMARAIVLGLRYDGLYQRYQNALRESEKLKSDIAGLTALLKRRNSNCVSLERQKQVLIKRMDTTFGS